MQHDFRVNLWEESYTRKENYIFYPKEEVVKFLNRFVMKKTAWKSNKPILECSSELRGFDLGCGIGRQTVLFEEFGIKGFGADISANAIIAARQLSADMGYDMKDRFVQLNPDRVAIPFEDNYFHIAVSDSVLDSMHFTIAKDYLKELDRCVQDLLFISLASGSVVGNSFNEDVEVETPHEKGTIQSYYNSAKLNELLTNTNWKIKWMNEVVEITQQEKIARYHIVLNK